MKKCGIGPTLGEKQSQAPRDIETDTMVSLEDFDKPVKTKEKGTPTEKQLEEDVIMTNPSVDSMESRG